MDQGPRDILHLEVELDGQRTSFDLAPGKSILVGRKADADIHIGRSSTSSEHLRIDWNGVEVTIEDLGSKFGTFRMPQEGPFQKATFPGKYGPLELKVSKSRLILNWKSTSYQVEGTEVLGKTAVQKTEVVPVPVADLKLETKPVVARVAPAESLPSSEAASAKTRPPVDTELARRGLRQGLIVEMGLIGASFATALTWAPFRELMKVKGVVSRGAWLDLFGIWFDGMLNPAALAVVAFGLLFVLIQVLRARRELKLGYLLGGMGFAIAVGWPVIGAARLNISAADMGAARRLVALSATDSPEKNVEALNAEIDEIRKIYLPRFEGSSLLFKTLANRRRVRALKECDGVGDAPWDNKKTCLVLLFAGFVETREETHPVLLQKSSSFASLLLALDALTRLVEVEGLDSPLIPFFLQSLDLVQLPADRAELARLLLETDPTKKAETGRLLHSIRVELERRLARSYDDRGIPALFRVQVPGPLENGI